MAKLSPAAESARAQLLALKNTRSLSGLRERVESIVAPLKESEVMAIARELDGRAGRNRASATNFIYYEVSAMARALESQKV